MELVSPGGSEASIIATSSPPLNENGARCQHRRKAQPPQAFPVINRVVHNGGKVPARVPFSPVGNACGKPDRRLANESSRRWRLRALVPLDGSKPGFCHALKRRRVGAAGRQARDADTCPRASVDVLYTEAASDPGACTCETNLSAKRQTAKAPTRLPCAHVFPRWPGDSQAPQGAGSQATFGVAVSLAAPGPWSTLRLMTTT